MSRDILELAAPEEISLAGYFARSSFASAFAPPWKQELSPPNLRSAFQRRMVLADRSRAFAQELGALDVDALLVDFIDERFDLLLDPWGTPVTLSNEAIEGGIEIDDARRLRAGTEAWFELWERGWSRFVAEARAAGVWERVVLNRVTWSVRTEGGDDFMPSYGAAGIAAANADLERLYGAAERELGADQVLRFDARVLVGSDTHQWGKSPFHYTPEYYRVALEQLRSFAARQRANRAARELASARVGRLELVPGMLQDAPISRLIRVGVERRLRVLVELEGSDKVARNQALLLLSSPALSESELSALGLMRSHDPEVGAFAYLTTAPGVARSELVFEVPPGIETLRLGLRSWCPTGELRLLAASFESV